MEGRQSLAQGRKGERSGKEERLSKYAVTVIVSMKTCGVVGFDLVEDRGRGLRETICVLQMEIPLTDLTSATVMSRSSCDLET